MNVCTKPANLLQSILSSAVKSSETGTTCNMTRFCQLQIILRFVSFDHAVLQQNLDSSFPQVFCSIKTFGERSCAVVGQ